MLAIHYTGKDKNPPKIVILDGFTLNPGDLSWEQLARLGNVEICERTSADEILPRCAGADCVLTNKTPLNAGTIAALPQLRYIGVLATGYNVVDVAAAHARAIPVTNVPAYGTESVAQHVFALLLELTQQVGSHSSGVRDGKWTHAVDFCYWDSPLVELYGLTIGIIGFGSIGRAVARIAGAFGMHILVHSRSQPSDLPTGAQWVDRDTLFARSDVISLHCPLSPQTQGFINAQTIARMKPTALLINTGRGPLIDEAALAQALNSGRIAGAGLDVLSCEPPHPDNPLLNAHNCIITPHIAWATHAARRRLLATAVRNLAAFLDAKPVNCVNA